MRDALAHIDDIRTRVGSARCMLLLDFDGTLAPIVTDPSAAHLSADMAVALRECAERYPVAIVSGRALSDIESRVGITGLWYSGSHGLEWRLDGDSVHKETPEPQRTAMHAAMSILEALARETPGVIYEDKVHCAALNYRALSDGDAAAFSARAHAAVADELDKGLRVLDGMRTFEVTPAIDWTKGECAKMLLHEAQKRSIAPLVPVYIGDSITDEDAFHALAQGITVRVGETPDSAAEYFVPSQDSVRMLLLRLCEIPLA